MAIESKNRSLAKAVSWRLIASITTTIIAFSFGLPAKAIGLVFFADLIIKFILYYLHERIWTRIKFGVKD
jgi:adenylylsulfate kinase